MAGLPTPPASRQNSELPEAHIKQNSEADSCTKLIQSLDNALERYLGLLDRHQKLQAELTKKLSSGFLSLAHANYTCPPGRRYGADYYDERMKATRKMAIKSLTDSEGNNDVGKDSGELDGWDQLGNPKHIFAMETTTSNPLVQQQPGTNDDGGGAELEPDNTDEDQSNTTSEPKVSPDRPRFTDPIHWYGVLVPPSLRSAQKSFTEGVDQCLPEMASVVVQMQVIEREIERLRSELGQAYLHGTS